ncbi:hypothetical protein CDV36_013694 [Fusarium kuroshium]|uniref:Mid2 domain-containing protein n=2 Tax=Fusarium solani species complex TaxID=232080 RepID=A0A3M2RMY7_9HYPO|nr:hypothetical protein CDV36_013694 [Fusarium kuroshium]RSL80094.1 hypothetical protein CEP51_006817 [Fusarium floridanum]
MASLRFIFVIALSSTLAHAQCYYPDGKDATTDKPCQPDAEVSACCADGYVCMSTGMCQFVDLEGTGRFARGSCTNQDWSSSSCPNYCIDGDEAGGADVTRCQGYTDRFFCPKSQTANVCKDESKALLLSEPTAITTILAASSTVQSTKSTQSTETSEAATTTSSQETTSTPKDEETGTSASTSPNETGPADSDSSSDSGPSPAVLGGAIGGSIGGFLLGGFGVWLIFFLRKGKVDPSRVVPEPENGYKDNHQPGPKAEMPAETVPAELPGYSVDDRSRQE